LAPIMEDEGLALLERCLASTRVYLEYGAGGSTLLAARHAQAVHTVDSSQEWIATVRKQVGPHVALYHCDIGPVGDWGRPTDFSGVLRYHQYATAPWTADPDPDLILIDGRFRVASFLYSLFRARPGTTILFDDYANRPGYHVVERFCAPLEWHGRMALFRSVQPPPQAIALLLERSLDPD
jgi:hypothetical protein